MSLRVERPSRGLGPTRRRFNRSKSAIPVKIAPIQDDATPSTISIDAISVDIAENGIGVLTTVPVKRSKFVLLTLCFGGDREVNVVSRVVQYQSSGDLYRVGFEFIFENDSDRARALESIAESLGQPV